MAKKFLKLITESSYDIEINEDSNKNLYVAGIFSTAETTNANGRTYPRSILERETNKLLQGSIAQRTCLGELGHPTKPETSLERAALLTEKLEWRGNHVFGKARVLNTPHGKILRSLIEEGVKVGISSRGLGTVGENGTVNEDLQILCWDAVAAPSNKNSWLNGIYEGKTFEVFEEEEVVTEAQKQTALEEHYRKIRNFLSSLK